MVADRGRAEGGQVVEAGREESKGKSTSDVEVRTRVREGLTRNTSVYKDPDDNT